MVDHANGISDFVHANGRSAYTSIVEVRTDPVDEHAVSRDQAAQPMEAAAAFAGEIENQTNHFANRVPLATVLPGAANDLTLGWNKQPTDRDFMTTDADLQVTFGVKLSQIPSLVREMTKNGSQEMSNETQPGQGHRDILGEANGAARLAIKEAYVAPAVRQRLGVLREQIKVTEDLKTKQDLTGEMQRVAKSTLSDDAFVPYQELEGLATMICMYLVAGQRQREGGQLDKNMVPLLVRHPLAALYATLSLATQAQLHDGIVRAALRDQLLAKTNREAGAPLFEERIGMSGTNTCGAWIDRVLRGEVVVDDISASFGKMKKIAPEEVGPERTEPGTGEPLPKERGVVAEQRSMLGKIPRQRWGAVARQYYDLLHDRNRAQAKLATPAPGPKAPVAAPASSSGRALPADVRAKMERAFGTDLGSVQIHEDGAAAAIGALAYAQGDHLHFAPGQYDPTSVRGQELLGHELAHVVQQRQGRVAAGAAGLNTDPGLEAEADAAGARAARGELVDGAGAAVGTSAVDGGPVQRKVGFEIEVNVLLSKGGPAGDLGAAAMPITPGAYLADCDPAEQVGQFASRVVMVNTQKSGIVAFRWDASSTAPHDKGATVFKPNKVEPYEPGRWVRLLDWNPTQAPEDRYFDPMFGKSTKVFSKTPGQPFDVVEDHVAQPIAKELNSIIEIVTEPRDEQLLPGEDAQTAERRFLEPVVRARELVEAIEQRATPNFNKRIAANKVLPGARDDLYLAANERANQNHFGSLQSTFGIQLGGVQQMMQERTEGFDLFKEPAILQKAIEASARAMHELGWDPRQAPALNGLLHLICMYLVAGHSDYKYLCSLDKNHVPFLIRHGLPSVREGGLSLYERGLLGMREPAQEQAQTSMSFMDMMNAPQEEESILDVIARAANRTTSEKLFIFSGRDPSVGRWIRAALYEDVDPLMADFWGEAKEIAPESVGPHRHEPGTGEPLPRNTGAILEARHAAPTYRAPDQWEEVARTYMKSTHRYNR